MYRSGFQRLVVIGPPEDCLTVSGEQILEQPGLEVVQLPVYRLIKQIRVLVRCQLPQEYSHEIRNPSHQW